MSIQRQIKRKHHGRHQSQNQTRYKITAKHQSFPEWVQLDKRQEPGTNGSASDSRIDRGDVEERGTRSSAGSNRSVSNKSKDQSNKSKDKNRDNQAGKVSNSEVSSGEKNMPGPETAFLLADLRRTLLGILLVIAVLFFIGLRV